MTSNSRKNVIKHYSDARQSLNKKHNIRFNDTSFNAFSTNQLLHFRNILKNNKTNIANEQHLNNLKQITKYKPIANVLRQRETGQTKIKRPRSPVKKLPRDPIPFNVRMPYGQPFNWNYYIANEFPKYNKYWNHPQPTYRNVYNSNSNNNNIPPRKKKR